MFENRPTPDDVLAALAAFGQNGADFEMASGKTVGLKASGTTIVVDRPGVQPITRSELATALEFFPIRRVSDLPRDRLHGPSYIYALLRDERIIGAEQPHPTLSIAVTDAAAKQRALNDAKAVVADLQQARDDAVARAKLRGASAREIAQAIGVSGETVSQIMGKSALNLFRVEVEGAAPPATHPRFDQIGILGDVVVLRSVRVTKNGFGAGSIVIDVPATTGPQAEAEVRELLKREFDLTPTSVTAHELT